MLPVAALAPKKIKSLLEKVGYEVVDEDEYNWAFVSKYDDVPVIVPKKVWLVPAEVTNDVIKKTGFERYSAFLHELESPWPDPGDEPPEES